MTKVSINPILAKKWLSAKVVRGKGRGKALGFPTLNLSIIHLPFTIYHFINHGVYSCQVKISNKVYQGLLHHGPKPTFQEKKPTLEAYLLNFRKEVKKGTKIQFKLLKYLRKIKKFKTKENLIKQVKKDLMISKLTSR